jgi:outer membrane protein assembly factor BamB
MIGALSLVLLAWQDAGAPARIAEWSRFRGAGGAGLAEDGTLTKPLAEELVAWRTELPGRGHSSPVVWDDCVFVTSEDEERGSRHVLCYGVSDGKELWRATDRFEPHAEHELNSFASSTPALDAKRVYVAWTSGEELRVRAITHEGKDAWQRTIGAWRAEHGSGSSPVIVGGILVVAADHEGPGSAIYGLEAATGEQVWKRERKSVRASYATPALHVRADGTSELLFASTAHGITSLDPLTGELHWEVPDLFRERCVGSPVIAGSIVFATAGVGGGGKESAAVSLEPDAEGRHAIVWRETRSLPYVPTAIAKGDRLFLLSDGGVLSCLASGSGELLWRERTPGTFYGSPILLGERILALDRAGVLYAFGTGSSYEVLGSLELGESAQSTPACTGGRIFLRTEHSLVALRAE